MPTPEKIPDVTATADRLAYIGTALEDICIRVVKAEELSELHKKTIGGLLSQALRLARELGIQTEEGR